MNTSETIANLISLTTDILEESNIEYWYSRNMQDRHASKRYRVYKGAAIVYISFTDISKAEAELKKHGDVTRKKNVLYIYDKDTLYYNFRKPPKDNLGSLYITVIPLMPLYPGDRISRYFRRIFSVLFSARAKIAFRKNFLIKAIALFKNSSLLHRLVFKAFTAYHSGKKDVADTRYYSINKANITKSAAGVEEIASVEFEDTGSDEFQVVSASRGKASLFQITSPYIGRKDFFKHFSKNKLRVVSRKFKQVTFSRILQLSITKASTEIRLTSYLIADRIALYGKYKSRKEYIMELWHSEKPNDRILFRREFAEYIKVTNHYISFDKGLCFDYDLFLLMIDYYLRINKPIKAYRLIKYTPYQHFENCGDYLEPYIASDDLNNFTAPSKDLSKYKRMKKELLADIKEFPQRNYFKALNKFYYADDIVDENDEDDEDMQVLDKDAQFSVNDIILIDLSLIALNTEDAKKTMGLFKHYFEKENMEAAFIISRKLDSYLHILDYDKNDMDAFATVTLFDFTNDAKHIKMYIGNNVSMLKQFNDSGIKTLDYDIAHRIDSISAIVNKAIYKEL
jgi:hypothetical protein